MKQNDLLIGAHVSIAGGFDHAIMRGEQIGATCIQIFTKSNRQWKSKPITDHDITNFATAQQQSSIQIVVAHASYLINLGSSNAEIAQKSITALIDELQRCESLKIPYLVLHPGTYPSPENRNDVLLQIAELINKVFTTTPPRHTSILFETMAGQGSTIGKTLEELALIIKHVHLKRHVGICIDTCHIFAAGYDIFDQKSYTQFWKQVNDTVGIEFVKVIHVNDSKKEASSNVDRHEHIGKGKINPIFFKLLMQDKKLKNVPKILETPKADDEFEDDKKNLATLRKYAIS